jgi:PilZ domain
MQELGLSVEVCTKVPTALDCISFRKIEVGVIDFSLGYQAEFFLAGLRTSASNRTSISFALTGNSEQTARALSLGAVFALEKPLSLESVRHTIKAAAGLIARERRRHFRYPVSVPAVLIRQSQPEIFGRTVNISENGMAFRTITTPLTPGSELTAQFNLSEPSLLVTADCRVCWSDDEGQAGLSFLFLPGTVSSDLQLWLSRKLEAASGQASSLVPNLRFDARYPE